MISRCLTIKRVKNSVFQNKAKLDPLIHNKIELQVFLILNIFLSKLVVVSMRVFLFFFLKNYKFDQICKKILFLLWMQLTLILYLLSWFIQNDLCSLH